MHTFWAFNIHILLKKTREDKVIIGSVGGECVTFLAMNEPLKKYPQAGLQGSSQSYNRKKIAIEGKVVIGSVGGQCVTFLAMNLSKSIHVQACRRVVKVVIGRKSH